MEKKEQYKESEVVLAHFARTLGHPARAAILTALVEKGGVAEGEIISIPAISQATVIQHLRELKRAGFIQGRIFGAKAKYHIDWDAIQKLDTQVTAFLTIMRTARDQAHTS